MSEVHSIVAVVTAGWSPTEDDPLAEHTQGRSKALIPIAGRPMITYVVDALSGTRTVERVVIVGLDPTVQIQASTPVEYVADAGGLLENIEAGLQYMAQNYPNADAMLLSSADIPTITPSIVTAFIEECLRTDHDVYYSIIARSVMETRFPESRRTYVHLREADYAGGDLTLIRAGAGFGQMELWRNLARARKHPLRQTAMFGLWPLAKLITRRLSLAEAERRACDVLNIRGRAVPSPYAEIGMDVDKPFQLEIARRELEETVAGGR
jgi:GTP:adenosylcobinamide-phosphate guanylyltransferase